MGQLSGSCGDFPQCSKEEPTIDGKLSSYWSEVKQFLDPDTTPPPSSFKVNASLSGAWYDPAMNGQGFLLEVLPSQKLVFVAWFTWDTTRPTGTDTSVIGEYGQRWLTALGNYTSNQMVLPLYKASGGVFANGVPAVSQVAEGTITVTFISCTEATLVYSGIPGVPDATINLVRLAADNVALCESLSQAAQTQ